MTTPCCDPPPAAGPCPCDGPLADPTAVAAERNRYFTGKYMTARDFRDEQGYFLSHHRLHHRVLHGSGIVCGLDVVPHPDPTCQSHGWVVVTPGIAIDCFGREVIVREPVAVNVTRLFPLDAACGDEERYTKKAVPGGADPPPADTDDGPEPNKGPDSGTDFLIGVRYGELCVEPVPVLVDESGCGNRRTPNRVRETACVRYRPHAAGDCWGPPVAPCGKCPPPAEPAEPDIPKCLADVLAPLCGCGAGPDPDVGFVPLALCRYTADENGNLTAPPTLKLDGRRYLPGPLNPRQLTHICKTNWNHGGRMWLRADGTLARFDPHRGEPPAHPRHQDQHQHHPQQQHPQHQQHPHPHPHPTFDLAITFDGRLSADLPGPDGEADRVPLYPQIFQVRYVHRGALLPLPGPARIALTRDRTGIACAVPRESLDELVTGKGHGPRVLVLHVTLNCDFLPDRYGRAVDGNHLKGLLAWDADGRPMGTTGDGVEGGVFESWFELHW